MTKNNNSGKETVEFFEDLDKRNLNSENSLKDTQSKLELH